MLSTIALVIGPCLVPGVRWLPHCGDADDDDDDDVVGTERWLGSYRFEQRHQFSVDVIEGILIHR
jgi:hypothetical protein